MLLFSNHGCSKYDCTTGNGILHFKIIYMKKFLHSNWLRAVQFLGNTVPKKEIQCQKGNSVQISLDFKFLNFLTTHDIYTASVCFLSAITTL